MTGLHLLGHLTILVFAAALTLFLSPLLLQSLREEMTLERRDEECMLPLRLRILQPLILWTLSNLELLVLSTFYCK